MKTASVAKMAAQFGDFLEASREQPVLVTRNGKPVAILLAVQDKAEAEHLASSRSRSLRSVFQESHRQLQRAPGISHDKFWREVEKSRIVSRSTPTHGRETLAEVKEKLVGRKTFEAVLSRVPDVEPDRRDRPRTTTQQQVPGEDAPVSAAPRRQTR